MTSDNRYSHGKIYKLIDNTSGMFYIGHTALKRLDQRLSLHYRASLDEKRNKTKVYQYFTPEKIKSGDVFIILIEEVSVANKRELEKIENEYIQKELNNILCLNTNSSYISKAEKQLKINERCAVYRNNNKEALHDKKKMYYLKYKENLYSKVETCACGATYTHSHKTRHEKTKTHINNLKINI